MFGQKACNIGETAHIVPLNLAPSPDVLLTLNSLAFVPPSLGETMATLAMLFTLFIFGSAGMLASRRRPVRA